MKLFLKVTARFYLGLVSYALRNDNAALSHFEDADLLDKLGGIWRSAALTLIAFRVSVRRFEQVDLQL